MSEECDLLANLLSVAAKKLDNLSTANSLKETDLFKEESNLEECSRELGSVIHKGDTDSSDDEENKFCDRKYNDFGREIKHLLQNKTLNFSNNEQTRSSWKDKPSSAASNRALYKTPNEIAGDVFTDPVFGMRIVKPLISSTVLKERMVGREVVPFANLNRYIQTHDKHKDWVIAGVIANKSATKTSQKGSPFCIWTLSDLKHEIKTVSLFLFNNAHKELWKTVVGTVVGILNPNVLDKKNGSKDEACLSIVNPQKVLIFGISKDFGTCKSTKKNGEHCNAIVNRNHSEYCIYHIKQEYQKCSKRSELQANFVGRGLTALRNKVLGKNEVFYAGKSYMAIPAKKSKKLEIKDNNYLQSLSGNNLVTISGNDNTAKKKNLLKKNNAATLDVSPVQRTRDLELLKKLGVSLNATLPESKALPVNVMDKLELTKNVCSKKSVPTESELKSNLKIISNPWSTGSIGQINKEVSLTFPSQSGSSLNTFIDLNKPVTSSQINNAKLNALKFVLKNGSIKKADPNSVTGTGKKRRIEEFEKVDSISKKSKLAESEVISDRFKKMMEATSKHVDLLECRDQEEKDKYFRKLEKKENMEEKMINTHKVACKAVHCLKCKYTNFSASDLCKNEKHPLKVFNTTKRFFQCGDCGNRTVTLSIIPTESCKKCGSGKWEKSGMLKDKCIVTHSLSIRGGEQKFVNSVVTDVNINLLMPEDN